MVRLSRVFACAGVLATATAARADELGPGEKGVALSIRVDAEVPAGKALILANTFRGADKVWPGQVTAVDWHPMAGDMQLYLVDAAEADRVGVGVGEREQSVAVVAAGKPCGGAFPGIRTIPHASPASEVRWTLRATITGDACSARLVGLEYLDASGKPIDPGAVDRKPITPPDLQAPAKAEPTKAEPAKAEPAKAEPARSGCDVRGAGGPGWLVLAGLGLTAAARRRRTSSRRR